jgi:hypothetical protein
MAENWNIGARRGSRNQPTTDKHAPASTNKLAIAGQQPAYTSRNNIGTVGGGFCMRLFSLVTNP